MQSQNSSPVELVIFDFEDGLQEWAIPDWAEGKTDHVAQAVQVSPKHAATGKVSCSCKLIRRSLVT